MDDSETRRLRLKVLAAVVGGIGLVLAARLALVQLILHDHYSAMATEEHWRQIGVPPRRGDILDTSGATLATSVTYQSVYASTSEITDPSRTAAVLAPIFGTEASALATSLSKKKASPILLQSWLTEERADKVKKLSLAGIFLQLEPKRVYAQGPLAAQVLGVVGEDNNGLSGIELKYDLDLAGKAGSIVAERDTGGSAIAFSPQLIQAPVEGESLTLTIDRYVQWIAERELARVVVSHHARGGTIVIVQPRTGAILAVATLPTLNPASPDRYSVGEVARYGIPAVSSAVEPGSVFSVFTAAAALDAGAVTPSSTFVNDGLLPYLGSGVGDSSRTSPGPMTVLQSLAVSSSVGASWMGKKAGPYRYYQSVRLLELGTRTGVDLPGESSGLLRLPTDLDWNSADLAVNSFGYGLTVTPLQLAAATAAIANGGVPTTPYIVRSIGSSADAKPQSPEPRPPAIRPDAAKALTGMLQSIVDDRSTTEGRFASVPGYALAGKAGSAVVPDALTASRSSTIATFIGFGPVALPRFALAIRIDAPTAGGAPDELTSTVFKAIASQLLAYYQIPPSRPLLPNGSR